MRHKAERQKGILVNVLTQKKTRNSNACKFQRQMSQLTNSDRRGRLARVRMQIVLPRVVRIVRIVLPACCRFNLRASKHGNTIHSFIQGLREIIPAPGDVKGASAIPKNQKPKMPVTVRPWLASSQRLKFVKIRIMWFSCLDTERGTILALTWMLAWRHISEQGWESWRCTKLA